MVEDVCPESRQPARNWTQGWWWFAGSGGEDGEVRQLWRGLVMVMVGLESMGLNTLTTNVDVGFTSALCLDGSA